MVATPMPGRSSWAGIRHELCGARRDSPCSMQHTSLLVVLTRCDIGMGALCCCPSPEEVEEYTGYPNGCLYQNCLCLRCCVRWFLRLYAAIFETAERRDTSAPIQIVSSSASAGLLGATSLDSSLPDTFRAPPRPLPYDADPRYLRPRDGLVSRRDKSSMSYQHGSETEPLRRSGDAPGEALTILQRRNGSDYEDQSQGYRPDSPDKRPSSKSIGKVESFQSLADEEEICPTCLDGYSTENPKIPTSCGHHFHLSCIFEWQERSKHCPVCGKEMQFSESI